MDIYQESWSSRYFMVWCIIHFLLFANISFWPKKTNEQGEYYT